MLALSLAGGNAATAAQAQAQAQAPVYAQAVPTATPAADTGAVYASMPAGGTSAVSQPDSDYLMALALSQGQQQQLPQSGHGAPPPYQQAVAPAAAPAPTPPVRGHGGGAVVATPAGAQHAMTDEELARAYQQEEYRRAATGGQQPAPAPAQPAAGQGRQAPQGHGQVRAKKAKKSSGCVVQ